MEAKHTPGPPLSESLPWLDSLFLDDPKTGAEYFGEIARMSTEFMPTPEEAGIRARVAAHYAGRVIEEVAA